MDNQIEEQIREHALSAYPEECVGYIYGGEYHRLINISKYPETRYQLCIETKFALMQMGENLEYLVHSHPVLDNRPSELDTSAAEATGYSFMIIGTDGKTTTDIRRVHP